MENDIQLEGDASNKMKNLDTAKSVNLLELGNQTETVASGDDAGVKFLKQVEVVGELIAGEDSYPIPMAFHCEISNTTGKVITGATDVTTILQSDSDSFTGLFGGTSAGKYLLIGSHAINEGAKVKYDSLATVEPGNVLGQYYQDDIELWVDAPRMGTNSNYPHEAHGWNIAVDNHTSEQIFFGFNPLTRFESEQWQLETFNINGVDHTMYFSRFLIISPITGDPQVQQIKLHTNRIEMESTGIFKYGRARTPLELNLDVKESTTAPKDGAFQLTANSTVKGKKNKFESGQTDKVVYNIERPWNLDTSVPLTLVLGYLVDGPATGTIELGIEVSQVVDGFVFDGSEPFTTQMVQIDHSVSEEKVERTVKVLIPIEQLQDNANVWVTVTRAAGVGNDDLLEDVIFTSERAEGTQWKS